MAQNLKKQSIPTMPGLVDHYRDAGVDTDEAEAGLRLLTQRIMSTWPERSAPGGVQLDIGFFANVVNIGGLGIAITTDGVGSKAMIASMLGRYDTIGIDCVAMNVNDVICVGARPVSMVDYVAIESVSAKILDEISIGLTEGANRASISISGGETAQLRGMVHGFDLAGTAVGCVPLDKILFGQNINDGDVLIGIESNGIHSNGLSLARRAFFEQNSYKLSHQFDELKGDLGTELLKPTHIYVREALEMLERLPGLRALVHITSDGFLNLTRVKADVSFVIDKLPPVPPIFSIIQRVGDVDTTEMFSVYNMGIGFCAVVASAEADKALSIISDHGKQAHKIGYVVSDKRRRVSLPEFGLIGRGKHFAVASG
jgi:phosphoribosylformylglycinamidine cyclo-ligase